jgi:hypothetical protein
MHDWDFNCFIAAKIVFKQTSVCTMGSAKSPAAKNLMWFYFLRYRQQWQYLHHLSVFFFICPVSKGMSKK